VLSPVLKGTNLQLNLFYRISLANTTQIYCVWSHTFKQKASSLPFCTEKLPGYKQNWINVLFNQKGKSCILKLQGNMSFAEERFSAVQY